MTAAAIQQLITDHKRLIESEAYKYSGNVPLTVVQIEAYRLAKEAASEFDASKGVKFSTYLTSYLQKLKRLGTEYGAIVRVPEHKQFKINKLNNIQKNLEAEIGRPATISELSDSTGWKMSDINDLLQNRKSTINIHNSLTAPTFSNDNNDEWIQFVYHDLPPRDKLIFEHHVGFGGKPLLENDELAKKLGISKSTLNNRLNFIGTKLAEGIT